MKRASNTSDAPWPSVEQVREALLDPSSAFLHREFQRARMYSDDVGMPKAKLGRFAAAWCAFIEDREYAVRTFLRPDKYRAGRLTVVNQYVRSRKVQYLVPFEYHHEALVVEDVVYPVVVMPWVHAVSLLRYVEANLQRPSILEALARDVSAMILELETVDIAHGDLQHRNLLVGERSTIYLIDPDGVFVPGLEGWRSPTLGHPSYQLPSRGAKNFGPGLDRFAGHVIVASLLALSADPTLWWTIGGGSPSLRYDGLLMQRSDLEAPERSEAFSCLRGHRDHRVARLGRHLIELLSYECMAVPPVASVISAFEEDQPIYRRYRRWS